MSDSPVTDPSCQVCKKKQSDLSTPLKQCAKCHSQSYCSRECQKTDWKTHKKHCSTTQATSQPRTASSSPPKEEILEQARQTVELMKALSHDPNFNTDLRAIRSSASGLKYLADFVGRTFREYWTPILPPQIYAEMASDLSSFHGIEKDQHLRDMAAKFEEVKTRDPSFDKDAWPKLDREKYNDCFSRNFMAAKIVQTPSRQAMMGGQYNYSDEVKEACRQIVSA